MKTASFAKLLEVLPARQRRVSRNARWDFDEGTRTITLSLPAEGLCKNLQDTLASSPSYLFCLGYWLERTLGHPIHCRVHVTTRAPVDAKQRRHWRRSMFVIKQLERASDRFRAEIAPEDRWRLPERPLLNVARKVRSNVPQSQAPEHVLETSLCDEKWGAAKQFGANVGPIRKLERQLPLGLFDGSLKSRWTPGGNSQVDVWAVSTDGSTFHLFELKAKDKNGLGILPQSIYYGLLLHHVRTREIQGECESLTLLGATERIRVWLASDVVHPLVRYGEHSPLELLNAEFRTDDVQFGILPVSVPGPGAPPTWRWNERWPSGSGSLPEASDLSVG